MTINIRQALLDLAQSIGRDIRSDAPITHPHALELLASIEDQLSALAGVVEYSRCPAVTADVVLACELCREPAGEGNALCPACAESR